MASAVLFGVAALLIGVTSAIHVSAGEQDGTPHGRNFSFHSDGHRDTAWRGPECHNRGVLAQVRKRFASNERIYWDSHLTLMDLHNPREVSHRHWEPGLIASRTCEVDASLNDGRHVAVVYRIRSEQGFAGVNWGLDYCVIDRDFTYSYQPGCAGLRR